MEIGPDWIVLSKQITPCKRAPLCVRCVDNLEKSTAFAADGATKQTSDLSPHNSSLGTKVICVGVGTLQHEFCCALVEPFFPFCFMTIGLSQYGPCCGHSIATWTMLWSPPAQSNHWIIATRTMLCPPIVTWTMHVVVTFDLHPLEHGTCCSHSSSDDGSLQL